MRMSFRHALILVASFVMVHPCLANDQDDAESLATTFISRLTNGNLAQVYTDMMTARFRSVYTQQQFEQQIGVTRIQLSGASRGAPTIVGSQRTFQDPMGQQGDFYYIRCRGVYPAGTVLWDIWLQKVSSKWAVNGFFFAPAPPQQPQ